MRDKTKKNLCFIAAITILLLSLDFVSFNALSDKQIELCCDCPDFINHFGHSHNPAFDEVFCNDLFSDQQKPEDSNEFLQGQDLKFTDNYCSKVWQPPKLS